MKPLVSYEEKASQYFEGKIVRKDLTKKIKEGANVPIYVLEYLLGMYCNSMDQEVIDEGIKSVKKILAENYVRPDESEKIKAKVRETGQYTVIDKVSVKLNEKEDRYDAEFFNMGIKNVVIHENYIKQFEKLLVGGIWCIVKLGYYYNADEKKQSPFIVNSIEPIQMPNIDIDLIFEGRKNFTKEEWIDLILCSVGLEPSRFDSRVKMHYLARLAPLLENNVNLCELGPRGTGKSHIYKEIGVWDVVAFDEVAGINFKDKDGVQIMKDFMASGSFARGKDSTQANASMVFVGNTNQSVDLMLKTSHLFEPFPEEMIDAAFFDRMHCYIPGWEIPKMRPEYISDGYGFISDYVSEFFREMRKRSFVDAYDKYFKLGSNLNQRDVIAVKKMVSGLMKVIYPNGEYSKEDVREVLEYALEGRRRVKEQLKKIGGMEFYDVHFSYYDLESMEEHYVNVKEKGTSKLIPEGPGKPGHVYTACQSNSGMIGVYKVETEVVEGSSKFTVTGVGSDRETKESIMTAQNYFKANRKQISQSIFIDNVDFLIHISDLQGVGIPHNLSLSTFIALCSGALKRPVQQQLALLGNLSIGGTVSKVEELASTLQVCLDAGVKRVLIPMSSAIDISGVPADLFSKFQISFYNSPEDAVFKAIGIE
ncbi:MAG: hypothetical protein FD133_375 [Erysipelotrichaceae bacterium]|nr:MAG: hypothetical protein FD133_375 [Erysipelotrichaceae bacterium]